jgi:hypothetical protein
MHTPVHIILNVKKQASLTYGKPLGQKGRLSVGFEVCTLLLIAPI